MRILILGSGNVATVFAKQLYSKGYTITQVYSPSLSNANELALQVNAGAVNTVEEITRNADLALIAVSDNAISELVQTLGFLNFPVFHTAGSVPMDILKPIATDYGVIYPLQSLKKQMQLLPEIPVFIDGNTAVAKSIALTTATDIGNSVYEANDAKRKYLHLTAVFSSNFTNYLYVIAKKLAAEYAIPFEALIPLIELTANRVKDYDPSIVQTGPAARGDINTIQAHLKMLENHSGLQRLYREFSDQILKEFHTRN